MSKIPEAPEQRTGCHHGLASPLLDGLCPVCYEKTVVDRLERMRSQLLTELEATKVAITRARAKLAEIRLSKPGFHCVVSGCEFLTRSLQEFADHIEQKHGGKVPLDTKKARKKKAQGGASSSKKKERLDLEVDASEF